MKHLNFLSKSSSQSCGHSSVTLASTVGSPSAHRRGTMLKHVAFLLLFLFSFGVGNVWGAAEIVYTLDGTTTGGSAGYDVASDIEQDEISWRVTGNTTMNPWRLGGKGGSSKNATSNLTRTIYNTNPIADDITSIVIKTGTKTLNALTNINVKVTTGSNGSGTVKQTFTETLQASHTYTFTFQAKGTGNQYIQFLSADFYAETSSCEKIEAPTVTATPGDRQIVLEWAKQAEASSYTVTCPGGTVGEITGTTTKSCTITGLTNGISYTWTVTPVGDGTTYCAEGNTAASASATPNVSRTITYYDKDGQHSTSLTDGTNIATALNALYGVGGPTSCNTTDYNYFVGWKDGEISGTATSVTLLSTEVVNATTAAKSYYAVWSDTDPSAAGGWEVATSITVGDVVMLGYNASKQLSGISTTSTKYGLVANFPSGDADAAYPLTVCAGSSNGTFAFKNSNNSYLYWGSGNSLNVDATLNTNTSWTFTYSAGTTTLANASDNTRKIKYNSNDTRFAAYTSAQNDISLYKRVSVSANYMTTCCTELGSINGSFF